ncbi:MAG: PAS domain S-box protein [Methanomicrobiaceae archaeon]|nr:PAS domain S-box protein [Methanomicrobiaceae archaeon]
MNDISILYFFSGILGAILVFLILTKKSFKNEFPFILLILVASYYSFTYGIELSFTRPDLILSTIRFEYLGIALIPPLWLIFVMKYTRRDRYLTPLTYLILSIIPAIVIITAQSRFIIPLLYESVGFAASEGLILISINPGPIYLLNFAYFIISIVSGILILLDFSRHTHGIIKDQVKILALSGAILISTMVFYVLWFGPRYHIDITPLAYLFTLFMAFVGLFHYRLFSLVPVAYDSVFRMMPSGLVIVDNYGYVVEANEIADTELNCSISDNPGKLLTQYCPDWPEFNEFIDEAVNAGLNKQEREITCRKNNNYSIYHVQSILLKDRREHSEGSIIIIRNITAQKNAEEEIRSSEKRFRELFEQSPVAYISTDYNGRITGINPEFIHMTGYGWKEIRQKHFYEYFPENNREMAIENFRRFTDTGELYSEYEIIKKNGEPMTIMVSGRIQRDLGGNFVMAHFVLHDITARKKMEDSLSQANKKLNLLSRITRHDILNQLTVLKGYQDLSKEHIKNLETPDKKLEKYMEKESTAAGIIYEQIKFTEDYQDIGVNSPAWQNISKIFNTQVKNIITSGIKTETDVGSLEIFADPLLEKVFYNLLENSVNYGETVTEIRLFSEQRENSLVLIYTDNGKGIPDNEKENIFIRKYFRNSGLGLFLSREILAITNIELKETGIYGKEARFEIIIPRGNYKF